MLADDDDDDRDLFSEAISSSDTTVTSVCNGKELMKVLTDETVLPDCVFIDLNMPEKSGMECLLEIRQSEKLRTLPVIIYSTSSNRKDIEETYALGANLYVVKPGSFKALCDTLTRIVGFDWNQQRLLTSESNYVFKIN